VTGPPLAALSSGSLENPFLRLTAVEGQEKKNRQIFLKLLHCRISAPLAEFPESAPLGETYTPFPAFVPSFIKDTYFLFVYFLV